MAFEVILPEMGEGVIEGTLTRWLVKVGDMIQAFDPVAEIETDKVTTEIRSEVAGVVLELLAAEGDTVPVDTVVATIREEVGIPVPATAGNGSNSRQQGSNGSPAYSGRISPVVGRIAAEHKVDLNRVAGTGLHDRITKRDILAYVEDQALGFTGAALGFGRKIAPLVTAAVVEQEAPIPAPVDLPAAADELLPLSSMRQSIAQHMAHSKQTSPHVTTVFEFDFTAVAAHRQEYKARFLEAGARLTFTVYIIAAVVDALKEHPLANSEWTEEGILLKRDINIGMAVAIPDGLLVPVIKNADSLNLLGLARAVNDLAERARNNRLKPDEVKGGTFSITNHGTSGSLLATPVINQPQAAILGIGKIEKRVKVINEAIAIRPMAYASLTFDHRILDGATADAFVSSVKERIEQ